MFADREVVLGVEGNFSARRQLGQRRRGSSQPATGSSTVQQSHSCLSCQQLAARHPQVGQREQGRELRGVLLQSAVADLHEAELALDHTERVLDLGADTGLDAFDFIDHRAQSPALVQCCALARAHGHMPGHVRRRVGPLVCALVAGVAEGIGFVSVQQRVGLDHVVDVGRRTPDRVHQAGLGIGTDVGLHAEVPLVALFRLVHLGVPLAAGVLGRTRRGNQRGIDHRAGTQHQSFVAQHVVDQREDLHGQLVFPQQMAKTQDRALVGQPGGPVVQPRELAIQRHVVQRFFQRRVAQAEPLLHEVKAQHRLDRKGRAASSALRGKRRYQRNQVGPRYDAVHLVEKLALARSLQRQAQSEIGLLHGSGRRCIGTIRQASSLPTCAEQP